jgi:CRP-like cAMP-binding protein
MTKSNFGFRAVVFKEGATADKLYIVKSGEVLCLKSSKDRLIPVFLAKPGDIVGEPAMISDLVHTYSAISLDNSELIEIPASNFHKALSEAPDWLMDLTTTMISRLQNTSSLIAENRMIHPSIIGEEHYSSAIEIEFKKLLS